VQVSLPTQAPKLFLTWQGRFIPVVCGMHEQVALLGMHCLRATPPAAATPSVQE